MIPPPLFCLQRCEEIDGSLSFCAYNLKGANSDIQDLLKMKLHAAGDSLLHEQLEVRPILPFFFIFPFPFFCFRPRPLPHCLLTTAFLTHNNQQSALAEERTKEASMITSVRAPGHCVRPTCAARRSTQPSLTPPPHFRPD